MAGKKSNIITYSTIVIVLLVILVIVFKDNIFKMISSSPDKTTPQAVTITPIEDNKIAKLIEEAQNLAKEQSYEQAIAKLEEAQNHKDPEPTAEELKQIDNLIALFKKDLLAMQKQTKPPLTSDSIIDVRIKQAQEIARQRKYDKAIEHLLETKEYKNPEPSKNQHKKIDRLVSTYKNRKETASKVSSAKAQINKDYKALAEKLYKDGRRALDQKKVNKALRLFTMSLSHNPQHILAHSYKGTAHYRKKETSKAIESSNEALKRNPEEANAHFTKGEIYYDKSQNDMARSEYLSAVKQQDYENNAIAYYKLGVIELLANKNNEAISMFDAALAIENGLNRRYRRNAYYNKAIARKRLSDFDAAYADLSEALAIDPKYKKAYMQIADILYKRGENDKSITSINKIIKKLNKKEMYLMEFLKGKNYEDLSEKLNSDKPGQEEVNKKTSKQVKKRSKRQLVNKAVSSYRNALDIEPNSHDAIFNIARILFLNKEYKRALATFQKANKIKDDYKTNYAIALSYYNLKDLDNAISFFSKAKGLVDSEDNNKYASLGLGASYFAKDSKENMIVVKENLEIVKQTEPNNFAANKLLGIVYFYANEQTKSIEAFKLALNIKKDDIILRKNLANVLFFNKNFDIAIENYKEVLDKDKNDPETTLRLGEAYIKTGNRKQARETLTSLVNNFPKYKEQRNVQFYLRVLEGA